MSARYSLLPVNVTFKVKITDRKWEFSDVIATNLSGDVRMIRSHMKSQYSKHDYSDTSIMVMFSYHVGEETHVATGLANIILRKDKVVQDSTNPIKVNTCACIKTDVNITICSSTFIDNFEAEINYLKSELKKYKNCLNTLTAVNEDRQKIEDNHEKRQNEKRSEYPFVVTDSFDALRHSCNTTSTLTKTCGKHLMKNVSKDVSGIHLLSDAATTIDIEENITKDSDSIQCIPKEVDDNKSTAGGHGFIQCVYKKRNSNQITDFPKPSKKSKNNF